MENGNHDEQKNETNSSEEQKQRSAWGHLVRGMWRTPLGLLGISITTVSITLILIGLVVDILGLIENPYTGIFIYMVLPGCMLLGLFLIPVAAWIRRRQWHKYGRSKEHLKLNLSNHKHRMAVLAFIVLTVVNVTILSLVGYEGYHFTDSPFFCGMVCHQVMEPEYVAYQRSPHSRVACVECHIGPGAEWFVRAKISGLRQVAAVLTDSYNRPIPAPVHELRPARDTCEQCHWPEKFYGKKVKTFYSFSNDDQHQAERTDISLHIGGHNPESSDFEGIHWHVSNDVEVSYLAADAKRTEIAKVRVKRPDGSTDEFSYDGYDVPEGEEAQWRVMDCIDCHNRPTHIYEMPEERVDFGLLSKRINPDIPGIREDSLEVIAKDYATRDEAKDLMVGDLLALQQERDAETAARFEEDIREAGAYLLESYLNNVWPETNVGWGTYKSHLGHQWADDGFGCWRCHDDAHENAEGETISQDCTLCHDDPY